MVSPAVPCPHTWSREDDDDHWQCEECGLQQASCPHPTWRRSASGSGYVCATCGVEPEDVGDDAGADDER